MKRSPLRRVSKKAEVVAVRVTRYRCAFCTRSWSKKSRAQEHLERCWKNPATRTCGTCRHYSVCCTEASDFCGCRGVPRCEVGREVWVTPEGYTELTVHPRDCEGWES